MNTYFMQQTQKRNGFTSGGFLMSNLRFSGIVRIDEKSERIKRGRNGDDDTKYYIIKDEFGASFSCFDVKLYDAALIGESMHVEGKVKISKGSTYLNLQKIEPVQGSRFATQWDSDDHLIQVMERMDKAGLDQNLRDRWEKALTEKQYGTLAEVEKILEQTELTLSEATC